MRACNSGGCGAWSQLAFATPQAKLDAPTGLDIVPLPLRKARLTWTASANSDANTEASIWVADSAGVGSECSAGWCEVDDGLTDLSVGHVIKLDDVANSKGLADEDSFDIRIVATVSTGTKLDSGASDETRIRDNPLRLVQNALSRTGLVQTPILSVLFWYICTSILWTCHIKPNVGNPENSRSSGDCRRSPIKGQGIADFGLRKVVCGRGRGPAWITWAARI